MPIDEGLHIPRTGEDFDRLLDEQLQGKALDFVLSDLYVPERDPDVVAGDEAEEIPRRDVLRGEELADKALTASGGDPAAAGEMLGTVLANLPTDVAAWDGRSVVQSYAGSPYRAAVVSLFGAAGSHVRIAEPFTERARTLGIIETMPESAAASCMTEALCSHPATPEAGKVILQTLGGRIPDHMWSSIIDSYTDSPAHSGTDDAYVAKAADVMTMLSWLEENKLVPQTTRTFIRNYKRDMLDVYTEHVFTRVTEGMWGGISTEADYARFITSGQIATYRKLSGGLALAIELAVNSWYLQFPGGPQDVLLAEQVVARQDQILDILDISRDDPSPAARPRLPQYLAETVERELARRRAGRQ